MFIADRLIFLELQKTGGTHILKLLKQYTDGATSGKHNRLDFKPNDKTVIGSIRNPWDWYVSLWAYGVSGKGAIRARTGKGLDLQYYNRGLPKAMGKNWLSPNELMTSVTSDIVKPCDQWRLAYHDSTNPVAFQTWLKLLFDKKRRFDIGEGYGFSPLSQHAGLLTYRYFRLYTIGDKVFKDKNLCQESYVESYDRKYNITSGMIRNECLEEDFIKFIKQAGYGLTRQALASIIGMKESKTNTSMRKMTDFYYDDEALELVAERERFLIGKYSYTQPDYS